LFFKAIHSTTAKNIEKIKKTIILSVEHNLHCSGANSATCFGFQKAIIRPCNHKSKDKTAAVDLGRVAQ
jgi:hypothetical protein